MLKLIRRKNGQPFILGSVVLFAGSPPPHFAKIHGVWPRLRVIFQYEKEYVSNSVSYRRGNKQFTVSAPAKALGLPPDITSADNEGVCTHLGALEFVLNFNEESGLDRRGVILAEAMQALHTYGSLRADFQNEFGASLDAEIGVRVEWLSETIVSVPEHSWEEHLLLIIGIYFSEGRPFSLGQLYDSGNQQLQMLHRDSQNIGKELRHAIESLCEMGLIEHHEGVYQRTRVQYIIDPGRQTPRHPSR